MGLFLFERAVSYSDDSLAGTVDAGMCDALDGLSLEYAAGCWAAACDPS